MKKLVVFDLDGTLLNTLDDLKNAVNYSLEQLNLPTRTLDEVRQMVGNGAEKLMIRAMGQGNEHLLSKALDGFDYFYGRHRQDNTKPYPGIAEMLDKLNEKGIVCTVFSNKPHENVGPLCHSYFGDSIAYAQGTYTGKAKKPDPTGVFMILDKFAVSKEDALFVGDSEVDIETARNAGLHCISVSWGFKDRDFLVSHGATEIADDSEQLLNYILTI